MMIHVQGFHIETIPCQAGAHDERRLYRGAVKSLAPPTTRCILSYGENISFDASLVIYIYIVLIFLQL